MKRRKFLKINSEKTQLLQQISYLQQQLERRDNIISSLFNRLRIKDAEVAALNK